MLLYTWFLFLLLGMASPTVLSSFSLQIYHSFILPHQTFTEYLLRTRPLAIEERCWAKIMKIQLLPLENSQFNGRDQHGTNNSRAIWYTLYQRYLQSTTGTQSMMNIMDGDEVASVQSLQNTQRWARLTPACPVIVGNIPEMVCLFPYLNVDDK